MATLPASYPNIPYLGLIPRLHHGMMIRLTGEMLHHDRFNVEIKTGPIISPSDDINLHLSIRPNENAIVRNHMVHQTWGTEERYGGCPIQFGEHFEMLILAEVEQFKIAVNGRHYATFRHRIPLSSARFIHVFGNVKVHHIKVEGDPNSITPSAPSFSTITTSTPVPPYQPTPMSPYQHQPHTQYLQPSPYNSFSTTVTAVPSSQPVYPSGQYYQPPQTYYHHQQQPETYLSSQPYQQYPSYHSYHTTTVPKSSSGSNALKYA